MAFDPRNATPIPPSSRPSPTPHLQNEAFPAPNDFRMGRRTAKRLLPRRKRGIDAIVAIGLAMTLIAVACCVAFSCMRAQAYDERAAGGMLAAAGIHGEGSSTPQSEWRKGTIPMLFQTDPAWASKPYAGTDIATSGCGPTCLSMVYIALTGKTDKGPVQMAEFSEKAGFVQDGMTAWALMTDGAEMLGLSAEELPASEAALEGALAEGRPVITSMLPGDFTTTGHFIVIAGISDNGELIVRDPNSAERSNQTWDIQTVLAQCANLWAYQAR